MQKLSVNQTRNIRKQIFKNLATLAYPCQIKVDQTLNDENRVLVVVGMCQADVLLDKSLNICFKDRIIDIKNSTSKQTKNLN